MRRKAEMIKQVLEAKELEFTQLKQQFQNGEQATCTLGKLKADLEAEKLRCTLLKQKFQDGEQELGNLKVKFEAQERQHQKEDLLKAILGLQQKQAENQRLFQEQLLRQSVINEQLEAQINAAAAKSGTPDPNSAPGSAEQLLERRKRLAYVPEAEGRLHELTNSIQDVYSMLCNLWMMLELRAQLEMDPSTSHRGGAEALRAKLQFVEDHVYQAADGVVADAVLQQWLNDFDKSRGRALLNTTAKQAANADAGSAPRWKPCDDKKYDKKHDKDTHDDKKPTGGKGKEQPHRTTTGEAAEGSLARGGRLFQSDAVDHGGLQTEEEDGSSTSVRSRGVLTGCFAAATAMVERGEAQAAGERWGAKVKISRAAKVDLVEAACDEQLEWPQDLERSQHSYHVTTQLGKTRGLPVTYFAAQLKSSSASSLTPKVTVDTRLEVYYWEDDDKFYPGVVKNFNDDGTLLVVYDDGDEETLNLSEEKFNILLCEGENDQNKERGGDYKENKRGGETQNFFIRSLCGRWRSELATTMVASDEGDSAVVLGL
ncbi:hypothetical protein CYMTET_54516 [Cymbomonas tetramitiformis]|uniref:Uncharacterized protein n=1 Tax=Cymbomonas tetramitiformis TaxID=36881 RepID=A0AAE0EP97_9CHLO|nr:hypothetical protein CYMTET_54516 [Cymbomonas tetramitiformis]